MKRWEYKAHWVRLAYLINDLNEWGKDGWELVTTNDNSAANEIHCIFKREIQ